MSKICSRSNSRCQNKSETFKVYMALLAAAAVPATVYCIPSFLPFAFLGGDNFTSAISFWFIAFVVALAHASLLGIPAFLFAQKHSLLKPIFSIVAGFIVGILPVTILAFSDISSSDELSGFLKFVWLPGTLGASGGFAAWLTWCYLNNDP